jgi:hypothetical protein
MMEAISSSEPSVIIYQTIRRSIPQDNHLHSRRHDNLKSHQENTNTLLRIKQTEKFSTNVLEYVAKYDIVASDFKLYLVILMTTFRMIRMGHAAGMV